jgi:hypothetical protein
VCVCVYVHVYACFDAVNMHTHMCTHSLTRAYTHINIHLQELEKLSKFSYFDNAPTWRSNASGVPNHNVNTPSLNNPTIPQREATTHVNRSSYDAANAHGTNHVGMYAQTQTQTQTQTQNQPAMFSGTHVSSGVSAQNQNQHGATSDRQTDRGVSAGSQHSQSNINAQNAASSGQSSTLYVCMYLSITLYVCMRVCRYACI